MLIEPDDIQNNVVAEHTRSGWGLDVRHVEYAPLGFGSHHWFVSGPSQQRWFATVDDLRMGDRSSDVLAGALAASFRLQQAGHDFVVAPLARPNGDLTVMMAAHYVLAVYPHVDGEAATFGSYTSHQRRSAVIDRLASIHQSTALVRDIAPVDDLAIPKRAGLENTLATIASPWQSGPLAAEAQALLANHVSALQVALASYDLLADQVSTTQDRWVITHGEPHRGNTIVNEHGVHLIDWETARIAPPERDLWVLVDEDARSHADYFAASGQELDQNALDLYRRWWSLCEVSLYTSDLRGEHTDTPETQIAWQGLREHMAREIASYAQ